ncbi:MAG TPA: cell division protein ZapB [Blastocatellia bacterium]|nr:cell division protein ZapB [Blastocatellia bacterium]
MKSKRTIQVFAYASVLILCFGMSGLAQSLRTDDPIAAVAADSTEIRFQPKVEYARLILRVSTPDGEVFSREFEAGTLPSFKLIDDSGMKLRDGHYLYELRVTPHLDPEVREALNAARASGDDQAVRELQRNGKIPTQIAVQSGAFAVKEGTVYFGGLEEPKTPGGQGPSIQSGKKKTGGDGVTIMDVVTADDIIVQGSACIGLDCVNNESFGFDTIRLKENNTRIKFDDTSTSAGFPANDWQLTANDSASGGANKFSIEDITGAKVPFTITAGAATNSLFVDSTGRVGLRTSTPVLDLHINTSNTPAHRLEQNNSGGFTAQTWDIAGNEANFFVRDVTGGSKLPFRIRPGAPTSSIDINSSGMVGIGNSSPVAPITFAATVGDKIQLFPSSAGARFGMGIQGGEMQFYVPAGAQHFSFNTGGDLQTSGSNELVRIQSGGNVGIGTTNPLGKLDVNGSIFQRGVQLFADYVFEPTYTLETIEEHADFMWNNKHLPAVGARKVDENGREIVEIGARMRGLLEELEKAHIYISSLSDRISLKDAEFAKLEQKNKELTDRIARIEAMLSGSTTERK